MSGRVDTPAEVWKPVAGWETLYEVSSLGRVRTVPHWPKTRFSRRMVPSTILKPQKLPKGYHQVQLKRPGRRKPITIHRLVMWAFRGPLPKGMECCHENGNPA